MKQNIRTDAVSRLEKEADRLQKTGSLLLSLADSVSRDKMEYLDVPRELRRTAAVLEDGADAIGRIASLERSCSWSDNFLIYFRNEIYRLKMQLFHKLRDRTDSERAGWPTEFGSQLSELEDLMDVLFQVSGELAEAEYYKVTAGHYRCGPSWRPVDWVLEDMAALSAMD